MNSNSLLIPCGIITVATTIYAYIVHHRANARANSYEAALARVEAEIKETVIPTPPTNDELEALEARHPGIVKSAQKEAVGYRRHIAEMALVERLKHAPVSLFDVETVQP